MSRAAWIAALALGLVLALAAVGARSMGSPDAPARAWILAQVPAGAADPGPEPGRRYPLGSRVVRVELDRPARTPRELAPGFAAAGAPVLAHDAARLLFVGLESAAGHYAIWTCRPDGRDLRRAVAADTDCGAAAFLPDGRIVYSAEVAGSDGAEWALFVAPGDGGPGARITWSGGRDLDPAVLRDGRVVYASWQPDGDERATGGAFALFTVHPDGTGAEPFHGSHDGPPLKLQPRQQPNGDVHYLGAARDGGDAHWLGADWRDPAAPASPAEPAVLPAELTGAVEPSWHTIEAFEIAPRPRPQGHLSTIDPAHDEGELLALDARTPDGRGAAVRLWRVLALAPHGPPSTRILGEIPLEADGSFFARVPADQPLLLDLLDAGGALLVEGRTPFWVRPREVRACVGCHEAPDLAPPNRRPLAVVHGAVDPRRALALEVGR